MRWLSRFFHRSKQDAQLDSELRFHIEQQTGDNIAAGMNPGEARRRALAQFGGLEYIKEETRDARGTQFIETLLQDIRFALRMLRKSPGFTAVAILTLALGIGANTAIFTLIDAILLRDLPVRDPGRLVEVMPANQNGDNTFMSLATLEELDRRQSVFSRMICWWGDAVVNAEIDTVLQRVDLYAVDGNFYSELGASPYLGRLIVPADVNLHSGAPAQIAVLGYRFWRSQFGADPSVIGKTIRIENLPFEIIGVSADGFTGMSASVEPEITVPLTAEPLIAGVPLAHLYDRKTRVLDVTARLKDGVTFQRAAAQLQALWPSVRADTVPPDYSAVQRQEFLSYSLEVKRAGKGFTPLHKQFVEPLYVLMGIAGLVLLIACVNLASLLMSRAAARSHEMAVRLALGAGRGRLVRQVLTEALMLSLTGAALGLLLAYWGSEALSDFILSQIFTIPAQLKLTPDEHILGFTIGAALLTGILFGLAPAVSASHRDASGALQESSRSLATGARSGRILVATQVALSLVLLTGAALFVENLIKLRSRNPGFQTDDVLMASLFPKPHGYKALDNATYYRQMIERLNHLPGVVAAGISQGAPITTYESKTTLVPGAGVSGKASFNADLAFFSPGVFAALGMKFEQGRDFSWSDDEHAPRVAIVSQNLAKELFPRGSAVGKHVTLETGDPALGKQVEIIGIVNDAIMWNLRRPKSPELYLAALQTYIQWGDLLIRTNMDSGGLARNVTQAVAAMGHEYVVQAAPLSDHIEQSLLQERVTAIFSEFFGALALLLVSVGLYGLMSYAVTRRTREIGIRVALGAQRRTVLWMILRETIALNLLGVVAGVPCAIVGTRLIQNQLFGLSPRNPLTFAAVVLMLLAVGAVAGYLPARRAMRVDPMVALRHE